nr:hypothetical protein [Hyphomonas sp. Mor2]
MPSLELILVELIGWAGAALILIAYYLLSNNKLQGQSFAYQWMNLLGATGLIINSGYHGAIPSLALNLIWLGIAGVAIWNVWRQVQRTKQAGEP